MYVVSPQLFYSIQLLFVVGVRFQEIVTRDHIFGTVLTVLNYNIKLTTDAPFTKGLAKVTKITQRL